METVNGFGNTGLLIVGLRHHLSNGYHVMAVAAQVFDHRGTGRLIDDEVHDGWDLGRHREGKDILIGEHLGGVGQSSTDVNGARSPVSPRSAGRIGLHYFQYMRRLDSCKEAWRPL